MTTHGSNTMDILERLRERHLDPDAGNPSTADYAFLLGIAMALAQTLSDKKSRRKIHMKLNRTREEWARLTAETEAVQKIAPKWGEDLATLFAEVDRLTAQLAEREGRISQLETCIVEFCGR